MNELDSKIREFAKKNPDKLAIQGDTVSFNYQELLDEIETAASSLGLTSDDKQQTFAILLDNHPAWAVLDLALLFNKQCTVPLPHFFSTKQLKHALLDSDAEHIILDESAINTPLVNDLDDIILTKASFYIAEKKLYWFRIKNKTAISFDQEHKQKSIQKIAKITYTSGTTSNPKGVLLSEEVIMSKVVSLLAASEANENDVSLSILPLSTLLENIGGLYVPLYCGASVILLSPETTGLSGSSQLNQNKLLQVIQTYKPTAFIIIPHLLLLFVNAISKGYQLPVSLRFIAMGGAPVSKKVLDLAQNQKIPVYEGYGLSEATSVISVNNPSINRPGSVGKVLNCHKVKISEEGEILVKDNLFNGYLGQKSIAKNEFYATGDLGYFDEDDFLYITGRKKNVINTSFGRNISPEWIEKELEAIPLIAQCVVYGHGKPSLVALLVLREIELQKVVLKNISQDTKTDVSKKIGELINKLNLQLPDYARISNFVLADSPFSVTNFQLTGTGRPRREIIYKAYREQLEQCYDTGSDLIENNLIKKT